ncbi:MAG: hypothetical protein K5829_09140 [Treponema sp.]|nr:hypothetical protein [Treponema sp.]
MTLRPCAERDELAQFGDDCSGCQTIEVLENMKKHNPKSPLLIGELQPEDKVFNSVQKSWGGGG